jgi:Dehydrogenases with different specificities (related to short-chain alcohol dehydrogenases)
MDLGLAGRRAAVPAATAGLGFASATALAAEGVRVAVCGRNRARVDAAVRRLGEGAVGIVADLSDPDECERFVVDARAALGGLDILVTNGPGPRAGTFADTAPHEYRSALDLNLLSVVRMCYAAVPGMRQQGWGRIVAITSIAVRQPIANLILSNTARAGTTGFLRTLAREVAQDGVTVNSVQPGLHATERVRTVFGDGLAEEIARIPARTLGQPADLGAVVAFLCSQQARYLTGSAIPVDGGQYQALL